MEDLWQHALADEVRAELARSGRSQKDAYTALDVSSSAWQSYFKTCARDVPSRVLIDLAHYLGMRTSELVSRAEDREAALRAAVTARMEADLSPVAAEQVARAREHVAAQQKPRKSAERLSGA